MSIQLKEMVHWPQLESFHLSSSQGWNRHDVCGSPVISFSKSSHWGRLGWFEWGLQHQLFGSALWIGSRCTLHFWVYKWSDLGMEGDGSSFCSHTLNPLNRTYSEPNTGTELRRPIAAGCSLPQKGSMCFDLWQYPSKPKIRHSPVRCSWSRGHFWVQGWAALTQNVPQGWINTL